MLLADLADVADLGTFLARARRVDPAGTVRLQQRGAMLAVTVAILPGAGLFQEGSVLGMRVTRVSASGDLDRVVSLSEMVEAVAGIQIPVPAATLPVPWAAVSPPRGDWQRVGQLAVSTLRGIASAGSAEVARRAPSSTGPTGRVSARRAVWGRTTATDPPVPAGLAFGAAALGFLSGDWAQVHTHGRWWRLTTPAGYVLAR